jgi:hypothetical protein
MAAVGVTILIDEKCQIKTGSYEFNNGIKTGRPKTEKITKHICAPEKGREDAIATLHKVLQETVANN